jgi:uncharacterized protein (TIGR01244 family)
MRSIPLFLLLPLLGGCSTPAPRTAERPPPPTLRAWDEFKPAPEPALWLGGQPSEQALDEFAARGGRLVINLRTDTEMEYLPYYADAVTARGMTYVRIPIRLSEMDRAEADALRDALSRHPGPAMLHCASGGRATYLLAAHRMLTEGLGADEAIAWCEQTTGQPSEPGAKALRDLETARPE